MAYEGDIKEQSWGQRVIHFYDPDGHLIEVGEDMKVVARRFLNEGMSIEQAAKRMDLSMEQLCILLQENEEQK
jgi:transposase-like protein